MDKGAKRKDLLKYVGARVSSLRLRASQTKWAKDRLTITYPDGTQGLIHLAFVTGRHGSGALGVYSSLVLSGGSIFGVMQKTKLASDTAFPGTRILNGTSYDLLPNGVDGYAVLAGDNARGVAERIAHDVERHYVPVLNSFSADYANAVDFIVQQGGHFVRRPFTMCTVLLGLSGGFGRLPEVTRVARRTEQFYDYHRSRDPKKNIVAPIRRWFEANAP